jgi:methyl-accepting chemotaxis protein
MSTVTTRRRRGPGAALANMRTSRKLLVLALVCIAPSLVLAGVGVVTLAKIESLNGEQAGFAAASGELYHLDNRNSELKADAYRAIVENDKTQVTADTTEDIASAQEVLATLDGLDLPADIDRLLAELAPAQQAYQNYIDGAVRIAAGSSGLGGNAEQIAEENHELDVYLDELRSQVDKDSARAQTEADTAYTEVRWTMGIALLLGLVAAALLSGFVARTITRPLRRTVTVLESVSRGELDHRLEIDTRDEVGQMATALNGTLETIGTAFRQIDGSAQALAAASEELSAVAGQMSGSAQESATQATLVSAAAEQVSRNVQTVATGTEEMSASIREIAQNASSAAQVASQAVGVAQTTNETVAKLGASSSEVGNVIKVINSIAEQTNLLALNATIEAARAGEAGRGFAVVANEVKELAQETSKATEDISRRIEAIQADTDAAVAAIGEIAEIIGQINDTQNTIASAVEEQTATTNEMSRNVSEAAAGSNDIAQNISGAARSADDTTAAAGSTSQAAEELARMAAEMRVLVGQFSY